VKQMESECDKSATVARLALPALTSCVTELKMAHQNPMKSGTSRSLIDLLGTIQHLQVCGVDLYLDQQNIDTSKPIRDFVGQPFASEPKYAA